MQESNNKDIFDIGLIIFLIPAVLYTFIYLYEMGYLISFGIPIEFISIDLGRLIPISVMALPKVIAIILLWAIMGYFIDYKDISNPVVFEVYKLFKALLVMVTIACFSPNGFELFVKVSPFIGFLLFLSFLYPLLTQWRVKGYLKKLEAQKQVDHSAGNGSILRLKINKLGLNKITIIMLVFFVSYVMYQNGASAASTTEEFLRYENKLVVKVYGDYMICCEYDLLSNSIFRSKFQIINFKNIDEITIDKITMQEPKFID